MVKARGQGGYCHLFISPLDFFLLILLKYLCSLGHSGASSGDEGVIFKMFYFVNFLCESDPCTCRVQTSHLLKVSDLQAVSSFNNEAMLCNTFHGTVYIIHGSSLHMNLCGNVMNLR